MLDSIETMCRLLFHKHRFTDYLYSTVNWCHFFLCSFLFNPYIRGENITRFLDPCVGINNQLFL